MKFLPLVIENLGFQEGRQDETQKSVSPARTIHSLLPMVAFLFIVGLLNHFRYENTHFVHTRPTERVFFSAQCGEPILLSLSILRMFVHVIILKGTIYARGVTNRLKKGRGSLICGFSGEIDAPLVIVPYACNFFTQLRKLTYLPLHSVPSSLLAAR